MVLQAAHNADEVKVEILGEYVVQKRTLEEPIGILDLINKAKRRLMGIKDIEEKVGMPIMKTLKSAFGHRNLNEMFCF